MKIKIEIYGQELEVVIRARDIRNFAGKNATPDFVTWLVCRLKEAKQFQDSKEYVKDEIDNVLIAISNSI